MTEEFSDSLFVKYLLKTKYVIHLLIAFMTISIVSCFLVVGTVNNEFVIVCKLEPIIARRSHGNVHTLNPEDSVPNYIILSHFPKCSLK